MNKVKQVLRNNDVLLLEDGRVVQLCVMTDIIAAFTTAQLVPVGMDSMAVNIDLSKIKVVK